MKRNHEIRIKLTEEEYKAIKKKIIDTGFTISGYVRYLLKNSTISVRFGE